MVYIFQNLGTIGIRNKVTWGMDLHLWCHWEEVKGSLLWGEFQWLVDVYQVPRLSKSKDMRFFFFLFSSPFLETRVSCFSGNPLQSAIHQKGLIFILKLGLLRRKD